MAGYANYLCALLFLALGTLLALFSNSAFPDVQRGGAILITGASSGIGLSAAKRLHADGFHVFAGCRKESSFGALKEFGLTPLLLDVTNSEMIDRAVEKVSMSELPLVGLINNAGTTTKKPLETVLMDTVHHVFDVNVFGALEVTQKFLPLLRKSSRNRVGARIVFIGSVSGIISLRLNGVYSMSKYSLEAMADTFRRELHKFGISVSMVNPAYVNTNFRVKGADTLRSKSKTEKMHYAPEFKSLQKKMERRTDFASPCCDVTDHAVSHAITSRWPRTRYYPAVVAPRIPAWAATPLIRLLGVVPFTDRLLDYIVLNFF